MLKVLAFLAVLILLVGCNVTDSDDNTNKVVVKDMNDLNISDDFDFETIVNKDIEIQVNDGLANPVQGVRIALYTDNPKNGGTKIASGITNSQGVYASKVAIATRFSNIYVEAKNMKYHNYAQVSAVDDNITYTFESAAKNRVAEVNYYGTAWTITDDPAVLMYFDFSQEMIDPIVEGTVVGFAGAIDIESIAIDPVDGTFYFFNNINNSSYLYKIEQDEVDEDPSTPVNATYIGETGLASQDEEIASLAFINGELYGNGKKSKILWKVNLEDGSLTEMSTLSSKGSFRTDGLTQAFSGEVYLTKTNNRNSELWRYDNFPTGQISHVMTITGSRKIEALGAHPSGELYVADASKWYRLNLDDSSITIVDRHNFDFEGVEIYQYTVYPPVDPDNDEDGVPDSIDDYPYDPELAFNNYVTGTLAYEDLWPNKGDYDFNDLVVEYEFNQITNADNLVKRVGYEFQINAVGASFRNGFGVQLPFELGNASLIVQDYGESYIEENGKAILYVFNNAFDVFTLPSNEFINTEVDLPYIEPVTITGAIELSNPEDQNNFDFQPPYNPFLMVHGHDTAMNDNSIEVHLPNYPNTQNANISLFGTEEDDTVIAENRYYKTTNNLPWAINIPISWQHPIERRQVSSAYLNFTRWAESSGTLSTDWYLYEVNQVNFDLIYDED
ncbi:MAG: hypothetical protein B6226_05625 [Candidatus Cloacimonetes bacterium 4572_65]|nr:MAG: hypothetical protein B6226_05625 [Candidatus Cloacimonetes bacterium 4572_65]